MTSCCGVLFFSCLMFQTHDFSRAGMPQIKYILYKYKILYLYLTQLKSLTEKKKKDFTKVDGQKLEASKVVWRRGQVVK